MTRKNYKGAIHRFPISKSQVKDTGEDTSTSIVKTSSAFTRHSLVSCAISSWKKDMSDIVYVYMVYPVYNSL